MDNMFDETLADSLGERIKDLTTRARLSPRILSTVTKIHWTSIYSLMRGDRAANPLTIDVLEKVLGVIDRALLDGNLPLDNSAKTAEKTQRLKELIDEQQK